SAISIMASLFKMRDDDAGNDDGAAILGRNPTISALNLRATTAGDSGATAVTDSKVPFALQSFNRFGSMERAPKVCLFVCISSSRDRMKFKLHFLNFQTKTPTSHPFGPIVGGRRMEEGH